jgi:hypothetical protein
MRRFIALVIGMAVIGAANLVQPPNHVTTASAAIVTPMSNWPTPPKPPHRKLTKAVKHEAAVALKIRNKAQHGRVLDYRKAWRVTHNKTILKRYIRGVRAAHGRVIHAPRSMMMSGASCPGVNDVKQRWYGWRFRLDTCNATRLEVLSASVAASIAFIATLLPETPHTKLLMAVGEIVFALGAAGIAWCNARQEGVRIFKYLTAAGSAWCL